MTIVFMGGTCNNSMWRNRLIDYSNKMKYNINWFNPIVDDWTEECIQIEYQMKKKADFQIFVITPKMTGVFSIAEVVDASNKIPHKTIFCYTIEDGSEMFNDFQRKSLEETSKLIKNNGGIVTDTIFEIADIINERTLVNKYLPR